VWLLLSSPLSAQLVVRGDMIQMHSSKPGKTVKGELVIVNPTDVVRGGSLKLDTLKTERDMSEWTEFLDPHFNIPARSAVQIKYRIRVPKGVHGSYWTKFVLSPTQLQRAGMVKIRTQLAGYILLETPGGTVGLEFLDMDYKEDAFLVSVRNTGTYILRPELTLYASGKPYPSRKRLCFPGQVTHWSVPASDLPAGRHAIIAIATDKKGSYGTRWDLDTSLEAVSEITIFVPVRVRVSQDIGPGGCSRSLVHSSASFGPWRIGAGGLIGKDVSRANFSLGHSSRKLALNAFAYTSNGDWRTSLGATLNLKKWLISLHSSPFEEYGNLMLRYQISHAYIGVRASLNHGSFDWNLTASIPFDFALKFKKKPKRKKQVSETIIFTN